MKSTAFIPAPLRPLALSLLVMATPFGAARANGEFLQLDVARDSTSAVASVERRRLTFGVNYYNGDDGQVAGASVLYRLTSTWDGAPVNLKVGPSLGWNDEDDADAETEFGLKLTADRWFDTEFGGLYVQGDVNSVDNAWFLIGQTVFTGPGLTLEASFGSSDTYTETTLAASKRLGTGPLSVRAGRRFDAGEWFIGASINTF